MQSHVYAGKVRNFEISSNEVLFAVQTLKGQDLKITAYKLRNLGQKYDKISSICIIRGSLLVASEFHSVFLFICLNATLNSPAKFKISNLG